MCQDTVRVITAHFALIKIPNALLSMIDLKIEKKIDLLDR